jgi:hypothetical protein
VGQTSEGSGAFNFVADFEASRLYLSGSLASKQYRGVFGLPSADGPVRWFCIADAQPSFAHEAEWQAGKATLLGFSGSGLSRLATCDGHAGQPWSLRGGPSIYYDYGPTCTDTLCRAELDRGRELLLVRAGGDGPVPSSGGDIIRVVHVASSVLVDSNNDGAVSCGGPGTLTYVSGEDDFRRPANSFELALDWLDLGTPLTCPGVVVDGSVRGTLAELE